MVDFIYPDCEKEARLLEGRMTLANSSPWDMKRLRDLKAIGRISISGPRSWTELAYLSWMCPSCRRNVKVSEFLGSDRDHREALVWSNTYIWRCPSCRHKQFEAKTVKVIRSVARLGGPREVWSLLKELELLAPDPIPFPPR